MYIYHSAVAIIQNNWQELPIDNLLFSDVLMVSTHVLCRVTHTTEPNKVLEFKLIPYIKSNTTAKSNQTIVEHLRSIGNKALPTYEEITDITERKYAEYRDIHLAEFKFKAIDANLGPGCTVRPDQANSILFTKEGLSPEEIAKNCLFNINGYWHRTESRSDGVVAYNAFRSVHRAKDFNGGVLHAGNLGEIISVALTEDMIKFSSPIPNDPSEVIYFDVGHDLSKYNIFGCFGGVMEWDSPLEIVGDSIVRLPMNVYPLAQRFLNGREFLDFGKLEKAINEEGVYSFPLLYKKENLIEYFTSPYNFFLLIKKGDKELCWETNYINHTGLRGVGQSQKEVLGCLLTTGKTVLNYTCVPNDNQYSIHWNDDLNKNYTALMGQKIDLMGFSSYKSNYDPDVYSAVTEHLLYTLK